MGERIETAAVAVWTVACSVLAGAWITYERLRSKMSGATEDPGGVPVEWRVWFRGPGDMRGEYSLDLVVTETGPWRAKNLAQKAADTMHGEGAFRAVKVEPYISRFPVREKVDAEESA